MSIAPRLSEYLKESGANFDVCAHMHSRTSAETARLAHVPEHQLAKSVILEDDKGCVLAVVPADTRVQVGALGRILGRTTLRLCDEQRVKSLFADCDPGAVPAFGMAWGVETVVDEDIERCTEVYVECGDHEQLLRMTRMQFHQLMNGARHGHFSKLPMH